METHPTIRPRGLLNPAYWARFQTDPCGAGGFRWMTPTAVTTKIPDGPMWGWRLSADAGGGLTYDDSRRTHVGLEVERYRGLGFGARVPDGPMWGWRDLWAEADERFA